MSPWQNPFSCQVRPSVTDLLQRSHSSIPIQISGAVAITATFDIIPTAMSNEEGNMRKKKKKKKKKNKVDDVVKCNGRSRPYYFRRCKHKSSLSSTTSIDSLPDELVFQILLELEAEEIYNSAMLVCRRWYKITRTQNFVEEHLKHSSPGLLILDYQLSEDQTFRLLSERGGRRVHTFKYDRIPKYKFICWATCNGLTLEEYPFLGQNFFVANNTINKRIQLPQIPPFRSRIRYFSSMGYAPASKEYKVVCMESPNLDERCAVLTLGVDKSWRYIDTQHISVAGKDLVYATPLITEGFVHWAQGGRTSLLSLNLETEIITETLIPEEACVHPNCNYYLSTWKSLTLLIASPGGLLSWDVWELLMNPTTESGEWKKVVKIDLEAQRCRLEEHLACTLSKVGLRPVGWLNCTEELVLSILRIEDRDCVLYNVGTQETDFLDLGPFGVAYYHKKSLVWFD